jgi:hypothetical protein
MPLVCESSLSMRTRLLLLLLRMSTVLSVLLTEEGAMLQRVRGRFEADSSSGASSR